MFASCLLLGCLCWAQAEAAPNEALLSQVRRLEKQLGDNSLAKRDAAEKSLIELGPDVLKVLQPVTPKTPAEDKVRLERIRKALEKAASETAAQASTVTLQGDLPLTQVLAELEKQTGNKLTDLREKFGQQVTNPTLKVNFAKVPFWQAFDQILDQAGLTVYSFGGEAGAIGVVSAGEGKATRTARTAYGGLFRFEAVRVQASRDLRNPAGESLRVNLEINWEPRVSPILVQLPLSQVQATDETGKAIPVDGQQGKLEASAENSIPTVELQLPFQLPPRSVSRMATLNGELAALVPGQIESFEFTDLEAAKGSEQKRGGVTVTLDQRKNLSVYELRLQVRFEKAENAFESHRAWIYNNEAYLVDKSGARIENDGYQEFRQAENAVGVAYLFDREEGLKGCKFVYKTPSSLVKLPVKFSLQDIPLP